MGELLKFPRVNKEARQERLTLKRSLDVKADKMADISERLQKLEIEAAEIVLDYHKTGTEILLLAQQIAILDAAAGSPNHDPSDQPGNLSDQPGNLSDQPGNLSDQFGPDQQIQLELDYVF